MEKSDNKIYYLLILDRSGSMQSCAQSAISSFNEQLQLIKSLNRKYKDQEILVSLTLFNQEVNIVVERMRPDSVKELTFRTYNPDGMTALNDAIGISVAKLDQAIREEVRAGLASAIVVIITDGYENASMAWNDAAIRNLIKEYESTGKWTFSYLGSTPDAVEIAANLNIDASRSAIFAQDVVGEAFEMLNESIEEYIATPVKDKTVFSLKRKKR